MSFSLILFHPNFSKEYNFPLLKWESILSYRILFLLIILIHGLELEFYDSNQLNKRR